MADTNLPAWLAEELERRQSGTRPLPAWLADELQRRGLAPRNDDGSTTQGQKGN